MKAGLVAHTWVGFMKAINLLIIIRYCQYIGFLQGKAAATSCLQYKVDSFLLIVLRETIKEHQITLVD